MIVVVDLMWRRAKCADGRLEICGSKTGNDCVPCGSDHADKRRFRIVSPDCLDWIQQTFEFRAIRVMRVRAPRVGVAPSAGELLPNC